MKSRSPKTVQQNRRTPSIQPSGEAPAQDVSIPLTDKRADAAAQRKLAELIQTSPKMQQATQMQAIANKFTGQRQVFRGGPGAPDGKVSQLRGKTKYGAMMGNTRQGPHTIAHGTLEAVEEVLDYRAGGATQKYDDWMREGIILSQNSLANIVKDEYEEQVQHLSGEAGDILFDRYINYLNTYKKVLEQAEAYYNLLQGTGLSNQNRIEYDQELSLALKDLRDMHPDSTYGSNVVFSDEVKGDKGKSKSRKEGEKLWLYGKGERNTQTIASNLSGILARSEVQDGDMRTLLRNEILRDADTSALEDPAPIYALAEKWVNLLMPKRTPYQAPSPEPIEIDEPEETNTNENLDEEISEMINEDINSTGTEINEEDSEMVDIN